MSIVIRLNNETEKLVHEIMNKINIVDLYKITPSTVVRAAVKRYLSDITKEDVDKETKVWISNFLLRDLMKDRMEKLGISFDDVETEYIKKEVVKAVELYIKEKHKENEK